MKSVTFYFILAFCLSAKPIYSTSQLNCISDKSDTNTLQPYNKDTQLEESIAKLLPSFFQRNRQTLNKIQEGSREAVIVIGQTGSGKSALIGGLLGHRFVLEEQEITEIASEEDEESEYKEFEEEEEKEKVLVNQSLNGPKIGHSTAEAQTIFPQAYLDQTLAFIDTAGLGDTRKDGKAINLCSAIGLRSLIEKIGSVKCIIGVIDYKAFDVGRGSKDFFDLLCVTSDLLKNKSSETLTSSMVLAFTKVPTHITKKNIASKLKKRCSDLKKMRKNNKMTQESTIAEAMYKVLFPSYYRVKNEKNVPFFLINQSSLLKQGLVRKNMLPTLQNAKKTASKHIGLMLNPYLLQKTTDWLTKRGASIAKDIRSKEHIAEKITVIKTHLKIEQEELLEQEKLLNELTHSNNQNIQTQKELIIKRLNETIKNNTKVIKELDISSQQKSKEQALLLNAIAIVDTNNIVFYKKLHSSYDNRTNEYKYSYTGLPINHIIYRGQYKIKDPKLNDTLSDNYKIISIRKNYNQGRLAIILKNDINTTAWVAEGLVTAITQLTTFATQGMRNLANIAVDSSLFAAKHSLPSYFDIYAKKKHIYHDNINTINIQLRRCEIILFVLNVLKNILQKQVKSSKNQLQKYTSDTWEGKRVIEWVKRAINVTNQEIKRIQLDLTKFRSELNSLNQKLKKNEIIPYIITQVAPFIEFHPNQQHNINACKRYIHTVKKNSQDSNKHTDNQPGLWLENNNNNIQNEGEQKQNDTHKENISSSSNLTSSLLLGTTLISGSLLKKKN